MNLFFWRKKKAPAEPRKPISGSLELGGRSWEVREEKRGGKQPQLFVLEATDGSGARLHVRPLPDLQVTTLEEVLHLAADADIRWVTVRDRVWEVRLVVRADPDRPIQYFAKFISGSDVHEIPYGFDQGLGVLSETELSSLLPEA